MELQMAMENKIPVIAIVREDVDISKSTMVLDLPVLEKIIKYKN